MNKWLVVVILGATVRYFDTQAQRNVLWAYVIASLILETMLAGGHGELMGADSKKAEGAGSFFAILFAIVGAV